MEELIEERRESEKKIHNPNGKVNLQKINDQIESLLVVYKNKKDAHFRQGIERKLHALGQQHKMLVEDQ